MLVVLANCIKQCKRGSRSGHNRHCGIEGVLKAISMVLMTIGLSLIAAGIEGGGVMIGAFVINIATHFAVEAVGEQSKCSYSAYSL